MLEFEQRQIIKTALLLSKRFGKQIEVDSWPTEFTPENLARWETEFNLKPVYFPDEEVGEDRKLGKWIKPEAWFYKKIREGQIDSDAARLYKGWYLADFTPGVDYTDGSQVFPNDPLSSTITRLREEGKVGKYDNTPIGSRFAITSDEWRNKICPAVAEHLGFKPEQVRLERAIEFNIIGNLYDPNRGKFNTWEWFDDVFGGSSRLHGGNRRDGGLANVHYYWPYSHYDYIAGRPGEFLKYVLGPLVFGPCPVT